ncbi:hemicentin-2-like, partial [Amphibalanus amphitrite]|uniref:hemicentin-2-like n=1 Tax=Amphibalanus amphitrite TaxID=1232801 RepID=UPI001C921FE4
MTTPPVRFDAAKGAELCYSLVMLRTAFGGVLLLLCAASTQGDTGLPEVTVVAGQRARLPCPQLSDRQRASVSLVIWYKDDMQTPIYSFDSRDGRPPLHWSDHGVLGEARATYRPEENQLILHDVRPADQGRFRCRIDFRRIPTVTGDVRLGVIVPPSAPIIRNSTGHILANNSQQALTEGERLWLSCEVKEGYPRPRISWLVQNVSGVVVTAGTAVARGTSVMSELVLPEVRRADLRTNVTCSAENSNSTEPSAGTVTLDVYFRPLRVRLQGEDGPLSAGKQYEYVCRSSGSRPAATLTWYLNNAALPNGKQHESADRGTSISTIHLRPDLGDQGKTLSCRAHNPKMDRSKFIEDSRRLNIRFPPKVALRLSPMISADDVREGMDVFFDCEVRSNPPPSRVTWLHEGEEVVMDKKRGVIVSSTSLVLQNVTRRQAGSYRCHAVNTEGESTSKPTALRVMYAPVCADSQRLVYGVSRGEQVSVLCRVDSDPPPSNFGWTMNGSDHVRSLTAGVGHWPAGPHTSSVIVEPHHDRDYGTLLCTSSNRVGRQAQPCAFKIVPA